MPKKGKKGRSQKTILSQHPSLPTLSTRLRNKLSVFSGYAYNTLSNRHALYIMIAILLGLALWLRMYDIGGKDIWLDEANSVIIAQQSPTQILVRTSHDANPPFYYMFLHYWMIVFGQSEIAVRSLSALFGVACIVSLFFIGRKLFSEKVGWYAAVIATVAPIHVMYSQQVRMYTLLSLLALLSMYFLFLFLQEGRKSFWILYVLCTALAMYTHNYGLMLLPAQAMVALLFLKKRKEFLWWILGAMIAVVIYSSWIPALLMQTHHSRWNEFLWRRDGLTGSLLSTLQSFSPGGAQQPHVPLNAVRWLPFMPVIVSIILIVAGISSLFDKKRNIPVINVVWILVYGIVPLLTVGILSFFSPCYIPGRCDQLVFPAFCLLAAVGISRLRPNIIQTAAILLVVLMSFMTLYDYYGTNLKAGDKQIAEVVKQKLKPGDTIVCTYLTRASLEYYLRDRKSSFSIYSYPAEVANHLATYDEQGLLKDPGMLEREAELLYQTVKHAGTNSGRCILLYVPTPVNDYLKNKFEIHIPASDTKLIGIYKPSLQNMPVEVVLLNVL